MCPYILSVKYKFFYTQHTSSSEVCELIHLAKNYINRLSTLLQPSERKPLIKKTINNLHLHIFE